MKNKIWGILILIVVIISAGAYMSFTGSMPKDTSINGLLGGEKIGLYEDEEFKKLIKSDYGLSMDYRKSGSFDMLNTDFSKYDYLFPSSQLVLEMFKNEGYDSKASDIVFNSPIVLYSRKNVVDALKGAGLVYDKDGIHYVDMQKLAKMMVEDKKWSDIGLNNIYGSILVDTTDPNKSNSGNMFLGLLANAINGNQVVTMDTIENVKQDISIIYDKIGYMQTSSADMFNQFLRQGSGSYPLIAGYESQILEFSINEAQVFEQVKDDIIILYPAPTVWSSHVYIALTDSGKVGLEALKDPKIQEMAWKKHGFRTIVAGTAKLEEFNVNGLAKNVDKVIPIPSAQVMRILMSAASPI